ncbi:MAG: hypothetical protein L6R19_21275 [Alphaproteobacteria bacterium]|nr:hypothetical protein [Alphaproteobacteria bacterium]
MSPGRKPQATTQSGPMALFAVASLLLTFFVALTALSERETARARAVAESFVRRGAAPAVPVSVVPLGGDMPSVRSVERRWTEMFPPSSAAPAVPFGEGRVLRAALAVDAVFAGDTAELASDAAARLDALARLIAEPPAGLGLRLGATLGAADASDPRAARLAAMRARALLHRLSVAAPAAAAEGELAVGLARAAPGMLAFELSLAMRAPPGPEPGAPKPGG